MIYIPASYVETHPLPVDREAEIMQTLGEAMTVDGVAFLPPCAAYFTCLDLLDCEFYVDPLKAPLESYAEAVYLLSLPSRQAYRESVGKRETLTARAMSFFELHQSAFVSEEFFFRFCGWTRSIPFYGFRCIPPKGKRSGMSTEPYLYGAPWLASICRAYCSITGAKASDAMFDAPLCLVGHIVAAEAEANGSEIHRPLDAEPIKTALREAKEREKRGELHPWQIAEPLNPLCQLSERQKKARLGIVEEFNELKRQARAKK